LSDILLAVKNVIWNQEGIVISTASPDSTPHRQVVTGDMSRYFDIMTRACSDKILFVTEDGSIGTGPAAMKDGEEIMVLFGAAFPFVVRKEEVPTETGERWRLVGWGFGATTNGGGGDERRTNRGRMD
jgi:hypothetical protein